MLWTGSLCLAGTHLCFDWLILPWADSFCFESRWRLWAGWLIHARTHSSSADFAVSALTRVIWLVPNLRWLANGSPCIISCVSSTKSKNDCMNHFLYFPLPPPLPPSPVFLTPLTFPNWKFYNAYTVENLLHARKEHKMGRGKGGGSYPGIHVWSHSQKYVNTFLITLHVSDD